MQITEFRNAIIQVPTAEGPGLRTATFLDGALTISGLGHGEALHLIKLIEAAARGRQAQPEERRAMPAKPVQSPEPSKMPATVVEVVQAHHTTVEVDGSAVAAMVAMAQKVEPKREPAAPTRETVEAPAKAEQHGAETAARSLEAETPDDYAQQEREAIQAEARGEYNEPAAPEPEKPKRGRPPGKKTKEPEPAAEPEPKGKRQGLDPTKVEWPAPEQEPAPVPAPAKKPKSGPGGVRADVLAPPDELLAPNCPFSKLYKYWTGSGIEREPLIDLPPTVEATARAVITEEANIDGSEHKQEMLRRIMESNTLRWCLLHRAMIESGEVPDQYRQPMIKRTSMEKVASRLCMIITGDDFAEDWYAVKVGAVSPKEG